MERVNEHDKEFRFGDWGPKYLFRGPHLDWGVIILKPGACLKPHYHEQVEETFYFLEGEPKIVIDQKQYRVKQGDAFRIVPPEVHDIINDTDSPVKMVMIKYPYIPSDKVDVKEE
jgi:mannose-6-phosphate isomerase-like protein (cupin superfamily)